jgi:hypothetical protein
MSFGCERAGPRCFGGWRRCGIWLALVCVTEGIAFAATGHTSADQLREIAKTNLSLSEYQQQGWQVEDGLPANNVRSIAQRTDGSLVISSSSGISIFDGLHFRQQPIRALRQEIRTEITKP